MPSFRELLRETKQHIPEIQPDDAEARLGRGHVPRRPRAGRVRPGHDPRLGVHPPRPPREPGRDEARRPRPRRSSSTAPAGTARRSRPRRSSSSATPTSSRWPVASAAGRTKAAPGSRPQVAHPRAARPLRPPHPPPRGRRGRPAEAAREPGAAARRRRPRLAGRALPRGRGRRHARHRRHGRRRRVEPAAPDPAQHGPHRRAQGRLGEEDAHRSSTPTSTSSPTTSASAPTTCSTSSTATTSIVDGTDNFPTRYLLNDASLLQAHPRRARVDLPLRGSGVGVQALRGPVLPLPAARAAAARARAELRGGRRARRAARHHRLDPGARGDQAAARPRRPARRPAARLRRARAVVPRRSRCAATRSARRAATTRRRS